MIITAHQANELTDFYMNDHIENFNNIIKSQITDNPMERILHLDFTHWGYDWKAIEFIANAGYGVTRNSACLWWEVTW